MTARCENAKVLIDAPGGIHASFDLRNTSQHVWRASEGFAVGYQIFDPAAGTLVVDGARVLPDTDIAPGETRGFDLRFDLPPGEGTYRVYVSALREDVGWFYEGGAEFLVIDATLESGRAGIKHFRVATGQTMRRERLLRAAVRAITLPATAIIRNRSLIRSMVRRDLLGRYRGSFGGVFWTFLNPLILMLTYFFVFGVVLRTRFPSDPSPVGFALYFLAGMLPWLALSEAAGRAPTVMLEHRNFVKKLVFPVETLPVNLVASALVSEIVGLVLLLAAISVARGAAPASIIWLPLIVIPQILLATGICWFLAALGVFVRDLAHINGFLLTLWFFLTPICYPEASLPEGAIGVLSKNPMFVLVRAFRATLLEGRAPDFGSLWKLWLVSAVVFIVGHAWFHKLRKSFADIM